MFSLAPRMQGRWQPQMIQPQISPRGSFGQWSPPGGVQGGGLPPQIQQYLMSQGGNDGGRGLNGGNENGGQPGSAPTGLDRGFGSMAADALTGLGLGAVGLLG